MRDKELFKAIGEVDDKYIAECEHYSGRKFGRYMTAACLILAVFIVAAAAIILDRQSRIEPIKEIQSDKATSEQYSNIDGLLEYLSTNDSHSDDKSPRNTGIECNNAENKNAVVYNGYSYHITETGLKISKLSEGSPVDIGEIQGLWSAVFLHDNVLALLEACSEGADSVYSEPKIIVRLYSIADAEHPAVMHEAEISGALTGCREENGKLYLLTSDGECACGWSRLDDKSKYIPKAAFDGKKIDIADENIKILGSPSRVRYTTAVQIDISEGSFLGINAYYGDIDECYFLDSGLAVEVHERTGSEMYFFRNGKHTGKLPADADICSVVDNGEICRITGAENNTIVFITADESGELIEKKELECPDGIANINEIINEQNRQIISWSFVDTNNLEEVNYFAFVTFDGGKMNVIKCDVRVDYLNGIDMIYACRPFGEFASGVMLENGIFVRYNSVPDGIDVFDFSANETVKLYDSANMLGNGRFGLNTFSLGRNRFAVTVLFPGKNEQGEFDYREMYLTSYLYVFEFSGGKVNQIKTAQIPSYQDVQMFREDGIWYCTTPKSSVPVVVMNEKT